MYCFHWFHFSLFQSTLPRGSDVDREQRLPHPQFQSTLPRGSDKHYSYPDGYETHFNPRSQGGATCSGLDTCLRISNFNPRSQGGATSLCLITTRAYWISIHAPKGERLHFDTATPECVDFNPRSQGGATK